MRCSDSHVAYPAWVIFDMWALRIKYEVWQLNYQTLVFVRLLATLLCLCVLNHVNTRYRNKQSLGFRLFCCCSGAKCFIFAVLCLLSPLWLFSKTDGEILISEKLMWLWLNLGLPVRFRNKVSLCPMKNSVSRSKWRSVSKSKFLNMLICFRDRRWNEM